MSMGIWIQPLEAMNGTTVFNTSAYSQQYSIIGTI